MYTSQVSEMKELVDAFKKYTALSYIGKPEEDEINKALKLSKLDDKDYSQLPDAVLVLSNYLIYLKWEFSQSVARVNLLRDNLNRGVLPLASKLTKVFDADERRYQIIDSNEDFQKLNDLINCEKIKLDMLKPVMDAIEIKINVLKTLLERKKNVS